MHQSATTVVLMRGPEHAGRTAATQPHMSPGGINAVADQCVLLMSYNVVDMISG